MLNDSDFNAFYLKAKQSLERYRSRKEVNAFLVTAFADVEKTQSLHLLKETLQDFCKQMISKVNSVGLTAFGGTCSTCPCLKTLKSICTEINQLLLPVQGKAPRSRIKKSP